MAYVIAPWMSALCSERYEFHKPIFVLFGLTAPNPRGTRNHLHEPLFNSGLASGDSGLQLNLEIAQAVSQRRSSPLFQLGRRCVGTSGNVIGAILTVLPRRAYWTLVLCLYGDIKVVYEHGDLTKFARAKIIRVSASKTLRTTLPAIHRFAVVHIVL
jgi:hypothetical protein